MLAGTSVPGDGGGGNFTIPNTATTRMTPAFRWAVVWAILMFSFILGGTKSQSQCPQTPAFEEKGELPQNQINAICLPSHQRNARPTGIQMDMVIWSLFMLCALSHRTCGRNDVCFHSAFFPVCVLWLLQHSESLIPWTLDVDCCCLYSCRARQESVYMLVTWAPRLLPSCVSQNLHLLETRPSSFLNSGILF